jgi:hypothetical protein
MMRAPPIAGALMDIVIWLRSLGLGKYEAVFRENEIDETVLLTLTAEDLRELGVAALGHRVKLLDSIAALRGDTSAQGSSTDLKDRFKRPKRPSRRPCRAPSGDGDVPRLGRLNGTVGRMDRCTSNIRRILIRLRKAP